jgi:hypothetical protein
MSGFDKKYGIEETADIKDFHRSRRMFAIYQDSLYIAESGADYSHAEWFKRMQWMDESNDAVMETIVRGYVKDQTIFFYVGYDFTVHDTAIRIMHDHILELADKLNLSEDTEIMAGVIVHSDGTSIERMQLGTLKDFSSSTTVS